MRIRGFIAAGALMPSLAGAAAPIHLAPSSPWIVDYAENSCRLVRHFGTGRDETAFALESEAPGALDIVAIGKPLASGSGEAGARFVPLQAKLMSGILSETADHHIPSVVINKVKLLTDAARALDYARGEERRAHPEQRPPPVTVTELVAQKAQRQSFATGTTAIEIVTRRDRPVTLESGSLGDAMKVFDKCNRDSLRDWGVDPDLEDKIVRPVWAPNPTLWLRPSDYPRDMLMLWRESVVKIRVLVDAAGNVTKCTALSHFNEPEFNKITCDRITRRAHFEPAELADGTKVPSYYVNTITFKIAS